MIRRIAGTQQWPRTKLTLFTSLIALIGFAPNGLAESRHNVLFIAIDDLRPAVGCYGDTTAITPNIDRLASRGTVFRHAYCQQAVCSPSRLSLLTGRRPDTIRVWDLAAHFRRALPDVVTLPQHFKNHGYHTRSIGKIYHGSGKPSQDPPSWSAPPQYDVVRDPKVRYASPENLKGTGLKRSAAEAADVPDNAYIDGIGCDAAVAALVELQAGDDPFFLAVGFRKPHLPFCAPKKDWGNCLGGYEGTVHTPNIDRLPKRGTLFTSAHCSSPKCAPSRAAIMTGLRPSTTGLYDNGHCWLPNLPDVVTIPVHFRNHGYRVAGAGKIFHHTAGNNPPYQWDDFFRLTFRNDPWFRGSKLNYPWSKPGPYPKGFPFSGVKGLGHENDWGPLGIPEADYDDALSADYAVRFLKQTRDRPFFLACGLFRPHLPWYVPQRFFDLYPLDEIRLPEIRHNDLDDIPAEGRKLADLRTVLHFTSRDLVKWTEHEPAMVGRGIATGTVVRHDKKYYMFYTDAGPQTIRLVTSDNPWHFDFTKSKLVAKADHKVYQLGKRKFRDCYVFR